MAAINALPLTLRLALRMLGRDWRAGELRVLLAAVLIAVACVSSVAFFTDRIQQALNHQSGELLAADLRVVADHPLGAVVRATAAANHLSSAETQSFRSMIVVGEKSRLAEIKAVGPGYPLRGALKIASSAFAPSQTTQHLPQRGEAWVDPQLLQQLDVKVGDRLDVGYLQLRITAVLSYEPDRSGDMFSIAPRLLMNLADLPATGLIQEGSHVRYRFLAAGDQSAVDHFRASLSPLLHRGERIEGAKDARPEVRAALQRAQQFLGLSSVVAVILACVAIAMAARRYAQRHLDTCAMLRCFGASQHQINQLFLWQLLVLGLLAGPLGVLFGYLAQAGLVSLLGPLILTELAASSWTPVAIGLLVAVGGLLGFALPPVLQLREVPALRVLRRGVNLDSRLRALTLSIYFVGLLGLVVLVMYQAGDLALGRIMLLGLLGTALLLWLVSALMVWGLKRLIRNRHSAWHVGLVNLTRNARASIIQVMAFGVGLMVLLLLTVVRGDLLQTWAQGLSDDAPNRFVINIQPQQLADVQRFFLERLPHSLQPPLQQQQKVPNVEFFPMVRGRLITINQQPVVPEAYTDERAKRLAEREFNLSWADRLQADNHLVAGQWWKKDRNDSRPFPQAFSVEEGIAKTLGIHLGDRLTFSIAGQSVTAPVSSLRSVRWDSFHANFFVLASPGVLNDFPASYITSFYLASKDSAVLDELVKRFPNLTVIDIAAIMNQVRLIIDRVSLAVEFVFLFTLAAGLVVMTAAIQSTLDVRLHENAVLRALGARRRRLWQSLIVEFVSLGSLAGLLAAFFASGLGWVIAKTILELDYTLNPWLWGVGLLGGGVGVGLAGVFGTRQVVNSPPLRVLQHL